VEETMFNVLRWIKINIHNKTNITPFELNNVKVENASFAIFKNIDKHLPHMDMFFMHIYVH
jgi:hypothetical protein